MDTSGEHILAEFYGGDRRLLNDVAALRALLLECVERMGLKAVGELFHRYCPIGVTGVVLIEESHLSLHTWPEQGYAAFDFYTCGRCSGHTAIEMLAERLRVERIQWLSVPRGRGFEALKHARFNEFERRESSP